MPPCGRSKVPKKAKSHNLAARPSKGALFYQIVAGNSTSPHAGLGNKGRNPVRQGEFMRKAQGVSNSDSFIDEVTEEIRRDRLFGYLKRYGWIGVVLVIGVVGGTVYMEWDKSRSAARSQAFGDAMLDALDTGNLEDRQAAFASVPADGNQLIISDMIASAERDGDKAAALAKLDAVIAQSANAPEWHDLAVLRRVSLVGSDQPIAERRSALEPLAVAGRPYRALAAEQLAWLLVEEGQDEAAIAALQALIQAQDATPALRARANEVIVSLGGTVEAPAPAVAQ